MSYSRTKSDVTAFAIAFSLAVTSIGSAPTYAQSSVTPDRVGARAAVDPAAHIQRGESYSRDGRFDEAIREYEMAADAMRAVGTLPTQALWSIAELQHAQGNDRQAARTLNALADEAQEKGDAVVEASALMEAIVLYNDAGMTGPARQAMRRLEQIRSATELSAELSASIEARILVS
jgi:tetratricopeptide (TPR) repeat protein